MEDLFDIVVIALVVFAVLGLPWILLPRSKRLRIRLKDDFETRIADLTARIYSLENSIKSIHQRLDQGTVPSSPVKVTAEEASSAKVAAPPLQPKVASIAPPEIVAPKTLPAEVVAQAANTTVPEPPAA